MYTPIGTDTTLIDNLIGSLSEYRDILVPNISNPKRYYAGKPIELAEELFGLTFPKKPTNNQFPGLREFIEDVGKLRITRACIQAPRGGGKSLGLSYVEWFHNYVNDFDWLNLGGSEKQAEAVYGYMTQYVTILPEIEAYYNEPLRSHTENKSGAWIKVLAASTKSIRSPHAGGIQLSNMIGGGSGSNGGSGRGGGLTIDEECEADESIVMGAIPMVNTAEPSVICRASTFHRLDGTFKTLVDNYEEMGYKLYKWDCFDICKPCTRDCADCYPDFRDDIWEGNELVHPAYCGGKAKMSNGWMPIEETFQSWRESLYNRDWFEVEMMGWRPSSAGLAIKNAKKLNEVCIVDRWLPQEASHATITIDWGMKGECVVQVWQEQRGGLVSVAESEHYDHQESEAFIYETVKGFGHKYHTNKVRADSSHPYCNGTLANDPRYRMDVTEVNFQTEKELAVGAINAKVDAGLVRIPSKHSILIRQLRGWRRERGKIVKKDDHGCDAAICFFSKFLPEDLVFQAVRVPLLTMKVGI